MRLDIAPFAGSSPLDVGSQTLQELLRIMVRDEVRYVGHLQCQSALVLLG
jgi:hypothetical protein